MNFYKNLQNTKGFSIVEIIVAVAVFVTFLSVVLTLTAGFFIQTRNAVNKERATYLAEEAVEAARNLRDANFSNLVDGAYGVSVLSGTYSLTGSSDITDIFTRVVTISTVNTNQKKIDVVVSWQDESAPNNSVTISTYLTNWRKEDPKGGLTIYKTVINHGQTKVASDFAGFSVSATVMQGDPPSPVVVVTPMTLGVAKILDANTYTVSETSDANYITTFSGDCNSSGVVTIASGDAKTCTIINEEKPSYLTVTKSVINHGGTKTAQDFSLFVDSVPVTSGNQNTFNSGSHTVSETPDPGYTGTFSGDCNSSGVVILNTADNKTCTITNEQNLAIPTVTTPTVTNITTTAATLGANVTLLGVPAVISARGTCWGTSANPVTNCVAEGGTSTGVFTQNRTGFLPSTLYYFRGYATNSTGTGYSADSTFTTASGACTITGIAPTNYDSSGSTSAVVAKPTGVVQNDLMFAYVMHSNSTDRLTTVPTGWSEIGRHKNGSSNQALFYKLAGASEPASYTFGLSSSSRFAVTINAYRGCFNLTNPIDISSNIEYVVNNTTYRAASLNLTNPYSIVIMFPSVNASGSKTFALPATQGGGWTQDYANGNSSSQFSRNAFSKLISSSGATGVIDSIGFSTSIGKHAFAVGLKPQ